MPQQNSDQYIRSTYTKCSHYYSSLQKHSPNMVIIVIEETYEIWTSS